MAFQEHSTAFLQKVKKHEAPDYYSGTLTLPSLSLLLSGLCAHTHDRMIVIARPMDLATLLKRVKGQVYRTKKAFADDLDLIWSNCLSYNSHPVGVIPFRTIRVESLAEIRADLN